MDHLWSPWRYQYVSAPQPTPGCIFCNMMEEGADETNYIVHRARFNFLVLNLFPYTSGHLMVVPYAHEAWLTGLDQATMAEMMELAKQSQEALKEEYSPEGFNTGFNQGRCAGAGVADHIHLHVVPRWSGDANFLSVIGETRVLPEDLDSTYRRLLGHF